MSNQAKHAFGSLERIDENISKGVLDAYDILFVKDAEGNPYIGWIDQNGEKVIVKNDGNKEIVRVDELPTSNGDANVMYVYNNQCYLWDGEKCVPVSNPITTEEVNVVIDTKIDEKLAESAITDKDIEELFKTSEGNKETI